MRRLLALMIATWFGVGLREKGAGTYGGAAALPLCWAALALGPTGYVLLTVSIFCVGIWSVPIAEIELGKQKDSWGEIREKDQNQIVVDEVVGMLVACSPLLWIQLDAPLLFVASLVALALFRGFDIF